MNPTTPTQCVIDVSTSEDQSSSSGSREIAPAGKTPRITATKNKNLAHLFVRRASDRNLLYVQTEVSGEVKTTSDLRVAVSHLTQKELDATIAFTEIPAELQDEDIPITIISKYNTVDSRWQRIKVVARVLLGLNALSFLFALFTLLILVFKAVFSYGLIEGTLDPEAARGRSPTLVFWRTMDAFILTFFIGCIPATLSHAMFGLKVSKKMIVCITIFNLIMHAAAWWGISYMMVDQYGMLPDSRIVRTGPSFIIVLVSIVIAGLFLSPKVGKRNALRFTGPQLATFFVTAVYFMLLPSLWLSSNHIEQFFIRILLHPLVFETAGFMSRLSARSITGNHPCTSQFEIILPVLFNSFYGRFLVAATQDPVWVVVTTVTLALTEIFMRVTAGKRDRLYMRIACVDKDKINEHFKPIRARRLRADLVVMDIVFENMGMWSSAAIVVMLMGASIESALLNLALQLALEFIADFVILYIEMFSSLHVPIIDAIITQMIHRSGNKRALYWLFPVLYLVGTAFGLFLSSFLDPAVGFRSQ